MRNLSYIPMLFILLIMLWVASAAETKYTKLYTIPSEWCKDLTVTVTGTDITSNDYFLENCAESTTKNLWYCNCDPEDEFKLSFVNRQYDTKSYIIHITSGSNTIRRIVSSNTFYANQTVTLKPAEVPIQYVDTKLRPLEIKLANIEKNLNDKIVQLDEKISTASPTIQTSSYNDSALIKQMEEIRKTADTSFRLNIICFGVLVILAGFIIMEATRK